MFSMRSEYIYIYTYYSVQLAISVLVCALCLSYSPDHELVRHERYGEHPVEHVRDDLNRRRPAGVPEKGTHQPPELVVVGCRVADVPRRRVLFETPGVSKLFLGGRIAAMFGTLKLVRAFLHQHTNSFRYTRTNKISKRWTNNPSSTCDDGSRFVL